MKRTFDRYKRESSKAYKLFCIYRDLGYDRNLEKVVEIYKQTEKKSISYSQVAKYSSQFNWKRRAEDYDEYLEQKLRQENEKKIREANLRHADVGKFMLAKAVEFLNSFDWNKATLSDVTKLIEVATKLERMGLGIEDKQTVTNKLDLADGIKKFKLVIEDDETETE